MSRSEYKQNLFHTLEKESPFMIKPIGSIAYKLGLLCSKQYDLVLSMKPKNEWDIAAGVAICNFLNYKILDENFKQIELNKKNPLSNKLIAGSQENIDLYKNHISKNVL